MLPFSDLSGFLAWIVAGPGVVFLVGVTMSLLASNIKVWATLPHDVKAVVPFLLAGIYAYVASYLLTIPAIVLNPQLNVMFQAALFYLASQYQFGKVDKDQGQLKQAALQQAKK